MKDSHGDQKNTGEMPISVPDIPGADSATAVTRGPAADQMTLDVRIRLIELTAGLGEQEADRAWTRYSIMIAINGGLVAISSYVLDKDLMGFQAAIALLGVVLCIFWFRIAAFSQFYEERWRTDMSALINENSMLRSALRSRSDLGPRIPRPFIGTSTGDAKMIVVTAMLFWTAMLVYSVVAVVAK